MATPITHSNICREQDNAMGPFAGISSSNWISKACNITEDRHSTGTSYSLCSSPTYIGTYPWGTLQLLLDLSFLAANSSLFLLITAIVNWIKKNLLSIMGISDFQFSATWAQSGSECIWYLYTTCREGLGPQLYDVDTCVAMQGGLKESYQNGPVWLVCISIHTPFCPLEEPPDDCFKLCWLLLPYFQFKSKFIRISHPILENHVFWISQDEAKAKN